MAATARGKLGKDCRVYRNTATWASPTWSEVTDVKDLTVGDSKSEADASTRASDIKRVRTAMRELSIDIAMLWDPDDAGFVAFRDAYLNGTPIELLILTGDVETAGNEGPRADWEVTKLERTENLEELATANVTIKPGYTANLPTWYTVST